MKHTTVTAWELRKRHGERVRFETQDWYICEGKISIDYDGGVYIVHSNPDSDGGCPDDMMWYEYSWGIYPNFNQDIYSDNDYYNWIEFLEESKKESKTKETYTTQIIRNSDGLVFTKTHIGDESIEDINAKMKKYRSLMATHRNLFPKK